MSKLGITMFLLVAVQYLGISQINRSVGTAINWADGYGLDVNSIQNKPAWLGEHYYHAKDRVLLGVQYQWSKRDKLTHELAVVGLGYSKERTLVINTDSTNGVPPEPIGGSVNHSTICHLSYRLIKEFKNKADQKVIPQIGLSIDPLYSSININPYVSNQFAWVARKASIVIGLTGGVSIELIENLSLGATLSLGLNETYMLFQRTDNPTLRTEEGRAHTFVNELKTNMLRAGIMINYEFRN